MELIDPVKLAGAVLDPYMNTVVSRRNDHIMRMGVMTGLYAWHYHPNPDETFIGGEGVLIMETPGQVFEVSAGMIVTIPKGVPHRTLPKNGRSVILTIEPDAMETVFIGHRLPVLYRILF